MYLLVAITITGFLVLFAPNVKSGFLVQDKNLEGNKATRESGTNSVAMLCFNSCDNPSDYIPLKFNIAFFSHSRYSIPSLAQNTSLARSIGIGYDDRGYPNIYGNQWVLQVCQKNLNCGDNADSADNHFDGKNRNNFSFTRGNTDLRHYAGGELEGNQTWAWIKRHPQANHTPEITSSYYGHNDIGKKAVDVAWQIKGRCSYPGTNTHDCDRNTWTRYYLIEHDLFGGHPHIEAHPSDPKQLQVIWDNPTRYETNNEGLILTNNRGEITAPTLRVNQVYRSCVQQETTSGQGESCDTYLSQFKSGKLGDIYHIETYADHLLYSTPTDDTPICDGTPHYSYSSYEEQSKKWKCWEVNNITMNTDFDRVDTQLNQLADTITLPSEYKQERPIYIRIGMKHYSFGQQQVIYSPPIQYITPAPIYRTEIQGNSIRTYTQLNYSGNKTSTQYRIISENVSKIQWDTHSNSWQPKTTVTPWINACTSGPGDQINWIGGSHFPDNKAKEQLTITSTTPHPTRNCGENPNTPLQTNTPYVIQIRYRDDSDFPTYRSGYGSNTVREVRYYTTTTPITIYSTIPTQESTTSTTIGNTQTTISPSTNPTGATPGMPYISSSPSDRTLTISWNTINNGGSPLTRTDFRYKQSSQNLWSEWVALTTPTQTSVQITGLTNGVPYQIQIRAVNSIGEGPSSNILSATPAVAPSQPVNLIVRPSNQTITVSWDRIGNGGVILTHTQIRYKQSSQNQWPDWISLPSPIQTSAQLTGLTNGHTYEIQIRGINPVGRGPASTVLTATPGDVPEIPTNPEGEGANQTAILWWDEIIDNGSELLSVEYRMKLQREQEWGDWNTGKKLGTGTTTTTPSSKPAGGNTVIGILNNQIGGDTVALGTAKNTIRIDQLINDTTYQFQIRGVNSIGQGQESPTITVTPRAREPDKPNNLEAAEVRDSSTTLCWDPIEDYESQITSTQYRYKHSRASDSGWADWITMGYRKPSCYRITGLSNGIAYDFQVRAVNSAGAGSASDKVTATPISSPTTPEITRVQPGDSRITLYWRVSDEGSPLTDSSYRFKKTSDRSRRWSPWISIPTSTSTSHTVRALTNDVSYDFQIRAENRVGTSNESRIRSAVPGTSNPIVFIPSTPSRLPANTGIGGNPSTVNLIVNNNTVIIGENITVNFGDTDGNTHEPNIVALADMGVTRGCNPPENTRFCPNRAVTRAEMATFLVRAFELEPSDDAPFKDTTGNVHRTNINSMAAAGISVGCNPPANTLFCPDRAVTRAEMATFMTRVLELDETGNKEFGDTQETIHATNINRLATAGISQGCNPPHNTHYCPNRAVTRGEMATFLVRSTSLNPDG